jgi:hypothetical protein
MMMSARPRVRHELKTWPEFFQPTLNARKRFELRRDDRPEGYQVADELLLKEWDPKVYADLMVGVDPESEEAADAERRAYTGREVLVRVDYILRAEDINPTNAASRPDSFLESIKAVILQPGFVIMSVSLIS